MSILFVDDDLLVRHTALMVLEEAGYEVHQAGSVAEATAVLENHSSKITHLLTDVRMPGREDGIHLAELVTKEYPHIKIAVLSGYHEHQSDAVAHSAQFIPKPWTMKQVLSVIGFQG